MSSGTIIQIIGAVIDVEILDAMYRSMASGRAEDV